jgi:ribosomal protein L23
MIDIKGCVVSCSKMRSQNKINVFQFYLSRMTKFDIKNYFEKIYNIDVAKVNTRIQLG